MESIFSLFLNCSHVQVTATKQSTVNSLTFQHKNQVSVENSSAPQKNFGRNSNSKSRYTPVKIKSATFSDKNKVLKKKVVRFGLLNKKVFIHGEVITINTFCLFSHTFQLCGSKLREILELCCLEQRLCFLAKRKTWCNVQGRNKLVCFSKSQFKENR